MIFYTPVSGGSSPQPNIPEDRFPLMAAERFLREKGEKDGELRQALGGIVIAVCLIVAVAGYFYVGQSIFFSTLFLLLGASIGGSLLRKGVRSVDALHDAYLDYLAQNKPEEVREMAELAEGNGWRVTTHQLARQRLAQLEGPSA